MKTVAKLAVSILLICLIIPLSVFAQDEPALELRLSRDNGYGLGSQMQGSFSYRVSGPDNLLRVEYLMDGEVIGESTSEPFRYRFVTDNFELGLHEMSAVGYTDNGQRLESNVIRGQFVSPQVSSRLIYVVLGILAVSLGARFLFFRNSSGTTKKGYGAFGGSVCSNCGRPFARHWWALNLIATRFDRCPHCGKWQGTRPATAEQLAEAEEFEASLSGVPDRPESEADAQEKLRKQLEDSRFEDM